MKKILFIGCALCLILIFAAPSMALDTKFSGFYRVRGFCLHEYETFGSDRYYEEHSSDYLDMLLVVEIEFVVHPRLKFVTNFAALDKVWGENDIDTYATTVPAGTSGGTFTTFQTDTPEARGEDSNNIDWNQAYMEINTGIGMFQVGRLSYGGFNHVFMDDSTEADGIKYTLYPDNWGGPNWNPLLFTFSYAKLSEGDVGTFFSDEDIDDYRMTLGYFSDDFIVDNMVRFERGENASAISPLTPISIDKADMWLYNLYLMAKFGILSFEGEFAYTHGYYTDPNYGTGQMEDIELDAMGWFLQANLDLGNLGLLDGLEFYTGWAHTDGDKDGVADFYSPGNTINALPGQFGDFDVLFLLTANEGVIASNLGGLGNWSKDGDNPYGLDLFYIGGGFNITRDIYLSAVWGMGWADAVPTGSKQVGWEADVAVTWQIMDGLQYKALFAFFDADGFWEDAQSYYWNNPYAAVVGAGPPPNNLNTSTADDGHCWALMHQLILSF